LRIDVVWPLELYRDFLVPRRIVLLRGEGETTLVDYLFSWAIFDFVLKSFKENLP
jgi:hypothetical protein